MPAVVALVKGDSRYHNIARALSLIADQIDLADKRRVFVKPNLLSVSQQLASTHVDALRATLAFLRARYSGPITVGEGTGLPARQGFERFGYLPLEHEFEVELVDLNEGQWVEAEVYGWDLQPRKVRLARQVVESDLRVSVGPPKTHDAVIVTLSLKNMVMGSLFHRVPAGAKGEARDTLRQVYLRIPAFIKYSPPFQALKRKVVSTITQSDRVVMHQSLASHHLNLYRLAPLVAPHLSVIDGFQGMEGDGPGAGDPVDWQVAVASTDFLAADCLTTRLMGLDPREVGYLHYCYRGGLGEADPERMEVRGSTIEECARPFRPSPIHQEQLRWREEARRLLPLADQVGLEPGWLLGQ